MNMCSFKVFTYTTSKTYPTFCSVGINTAQENPLREYEAIHIVMEYQTDSSQYLWELMCVNISNLPKKIHLNLRSS